MSKDSTESRGFDVVREFDFVFPFPELKERMRVKEIDLGAQGTIFVGFCERKAYGKSRRRIVAYRSPQNVLLEFVGTDHYEDRGEVVCRLKEPGSNKNLRPGDSVPVEYLDFDLVPFWDHVTGPKAPNVMGVLVSERDMEAIIALSLIRDHHKRQAPRIRVKCNPFAGPRPEFPRSKPLSSEDAVSAVVGAILECGSKIDFKDCPFTDDPLANSLVVENSFAFLLAAALDRGATAERIWAIPYHLKETLGHLDPWKIKEMQPAELRELLRGLPSKPYYVDAASKTLVDVSVKVTEMYNGRAEAIWQDGTASEIHRRLDDIYGVGPGIASMIINLLVRWGRITVPEEHKRNIDVKPDVHVRRVMYRAGIAGNESLESCVQGARIANPSYPGALDFPSWVIGRRWCHARIPDCPNCVISWACHKKGVS